MRQIPTRNNYSFIVLRDMVLTYDSYDDFGVNHAFQKTILPGDYLWYMRTNNGFVYFIDEDGGVGYVVTMGYGALQHDGFIDITAGWVAPPQHANASDEAHRRRGNDIDGDALARLA